MANNQKKLSLQSVINHPSPMRTYSPKALEALYNCEKYDALRYKEELTSLLQKDVKEKGVDAGKTVVMENDPPLICSFKILIELKKEEETESPKGKELVFISSSSSSEYRDSASVCSSTI
ncbi:hypothetical protein M9H77_12913 [Catharanthus roseus]|uniref:Uncharacterized protein n=1 Tax=Catharanthus roseus TaxID=4058 RepID=A0ACC0BIW5_CATRO|nr:hypothetical protein M9H77_12913 [Catharanthus roseus]